MIQGVSPETITVLMFLGVCAGVFLGYPLAFVLGGLGFVFGLLFVGPDVFGMFVVRTLAVMKDYVLLAVPLFVFMGVMLERSGVSERLFGALHLWLGGVRGGLAIATILISTIFAACTGIVGASVVMMGLLALPAMLSRGYDKSLVTGTICAGGTLGILIPPSIMIVIYGPTAGISVGKLFAGAFFPGFLLSALYTVFIAAVCFLRPELGPPMPLEERQVSFQKKLYELLISLLPPIFLIMAVLGTIFFGFAAPTEAAAVGGTATALLAACYGRLNLKTLKEACYGTLRTTSMVMMVVVGAGFFTGVFLYLGGGDVVTEVVLSLPLGKWGILFFMMVVVFILGSLIDWIGIIMICVPLFTPIARQLGFNDTWFAMLVIVNLQMSFLTPPFAYSIFYLKGIAPPEITTHDIYKGVVPFIILQWIGLALCIIYPDIIMWLPSKLIK